MPANLPEKVIGVRVLKEITRSQFFLCSIPRGLMVNNRPGNTLSTPVRNICSAICLINYKIKNEVTRTERNVTIPITMVADE